MQQQTGALLTIKLLLVDDDLEFVRFFPLSLQTGEDVFFEIEAAGSLGAALRVLGKEKFDLVLLDLGLPDSQGIQTFEKLAEAHPEVAYVILSSTDNVSLELEAVKKGAQDYMVKGVGGGRRVARTLIHALERHRLKQQLEARTNSLEQLSILDPLTRLLNRRGLQRMLSRELMAAAREGTDLSVILLDLDNFKSINDTFGYATGDSILQGVAKAMRGTVRASDYVSRIGGDEFIILLPHTRLAEGIHFSERVRRAISEVAVLLPAGQTVKTTASLGVVAVNRRMATVDSLLEESYVALAKSKRLGKNQVSSGALFETAPGRVLEMLRSGKCFRSVKQPIWDLRSGKVDGYEFLSRTNIAGFEMPDDFFSFSKANNILPWVDERCLEISLHAAEQVPHGSEKHVNLFPSTIEVLQPGQVDRFFPSRAPDGVLCVEVSEQQILGDPARLVPVIQELKKKNLRVAIEGVGFGRSSLESLIVLQPDVIKIDKRLIHNIGRDPGRKEVLRRLWAVLKSFNAKVIAEGVENREDLEVLRSMGVPYGQGFLWGQPA